MPCACDVIERRSLGLSRGCLCTHEDLGSNAQHLPRKPGMAVFTHHPSSMGQRKQLPEISLASQPSQQQEAFSVILSWGNNSESNTGRRSNSPLWPLHVHMGADSCTIWRQWRYTRRKSPHCHEPSKSQAVHSWRMKDPPVVRFLFLW